MKNLEALCIDTVRALSVDQVQAANSGHPGLPLGAAPIGYEVFARHMKHNPKNPQWKNRDRFVLSAGHGSAMLYSLLYLFEYGLTIEDLKGFRQWGSLTPGHPEYRHTAGVETTTGPLGAGLATAVGFAMAEAHLAAHYNKPEYPIVDHYTYVLVGDGCLQEGVASEASSLAGTLKLNKLIVLYDSNNITIEGDTSLSFRENPRQRYEAYGFDTYLVEDGNDLDTLNATIEAAKASDKPSFIEIRTKIGYASVKEGTAGVHGEPLGVENVIKLKEALEYPSSEPFYVDSSVSEYQKELVGQLGQSETAWNRLYADYKREYPEFAEKFELSFEAVDVQKLLDDETFWSFEEKANATRAWSGDVLNRLNQRLPHVFGGSADLGPSTKTFLKDAGSFAPEDYSGKNIHFGIRENAMAAIGNGLFTHGGVLPYVSTFFVFADYLKPMVRLSAINQLGLLYVLTHDSIGVGEDGPTHEPVEQLSMLRATPNTIVYRPADALETAAGYVVGLSHTKTPTVMVLSRQNLKPFSSQKAGALKGGYVVLSDEHPTVVLIASGSEVSLALEAYEALKSNGIAARVVSMPSQEVFLAQDQDYIESVLPSSLRKRVAIEAGASQSWYKFVGLDGAVIGVDKFGASAPAPTIFKEYGFSVENIVDVVKKLA